MVGTIGRGEFMSTVTRFCIRIIGQMRVIENGTKVAPPVDNGNDADYLARKFILKPEYLFRGDSGYFCSARSMAPSASGPPLWTLFRFLVVEPTPTTLFGCKS
jgi:hypothetical protein